MKNQIKVCCFLIQVIFLFSCKKEQLPPSLTTEAITEISYTSAISGGDITDAGTGTIITKGICWGSTLNPTVDNYKTSQAGGSGLFTSELTGLNPNTQYYVRAYAINSVGAGYGNQVIFTTLKLEIPQLTTAPVTEITTSSAKTGGNVTDDKGSTVTVRGVCWDTLTNPNISKNKTTDGSGTGSYASEITGLLPGTTYHVRAYATNSEGTAYGDELTFNTNPDFATIVTDEISSITSTSAVCGGNISADGGASVTSRGICWGETQNPTINDNKTSDGTGKGIFTSQLSDLKGSTTYYVRSYAVNGVGTSYGNEISFTTQPPTAPLLKTKKISLLTTNSVRSGGEIQSNGGTEITLSGICWSISANPTVNDNKTTDGSLSRSFESNITNLLQETTYYLRAYAINSIGTSYGEEVVFKTYAVVDADSNGYYTVIIGTQTWLTENLKTTKYNDGSDIPLITDINQWLSTISPAYCWYFNDESQSKNPYGAMYNWYAVATGKLCPLGWHVPENTELMTMVNYLGGLYVAGGKLKETGIAHWSSPNTGATNETGFTALPGGIRGSTDFYNFKNTGWWWTATEINSTMAWLWVLHSNNAEITANSFYNKEYGLSVRCLKD